MSESAAGRIIANRPGSGSGVGEMRQRIFAHDWSTTPLQAIADWSPALLTTVSIMSSNRLPMLLWWGMDYICLYNDAYIPVLGDKHPKALGLPVRECWEEIWPVLQPLIDTPFQGGPATWEEDLELFLNRYGFQEETHWLVAYSPVPDSSVPSGIGGVLATVHETTAEVLSKRRLAALHQLGAGFKQTVTVDEVCCSAIKILEDFSKDLPFVLLYLKEPDLPFVRLAGTAGMHPLGGGIS